MIGNPDTFDAKIAGHDRILGRHDAFDQQRYVVGFLEAFHVFPIQRGLKVLAAGTSAPGFDETVDDIPLPSTVDRDIDGQAKGGIACLDCPVRVVVNPAFVAAYI